jgi:hypothetical protein
MRSVGKVLLALAIVLCLSSMAKAEAWVWWQVSSEGGALPSGAVATGGVENSTLAITQDCPLTGGTYRYILDMYVRTHGEAQGITAHASKLGRPKLATGTALDDSLSAVSITDMYTPWTGTSAFGPLNNGLNLVQNINKQRVGGTELPILDADGAKLMARFVLDFTCPVPTGTTHEIYQGVGTLKWAHLPSGYAMIKYGPSNLVNGGTIWSATNANGMGNMPVITITCNPIPEPATLVLLGLGALALIRRR